MKIITATLDSSLDRENRGISRGCLMHCKRCNGLMLVEHCVEDELEEQLAGRGALRCVNCGAMVTVRMLRNLMARQAEGSKASRPSVCIRSV